MSWSARTAPPRSSQPDIVVVSCGAINSAALLLRSANDKHPRGLANGSDVVGRHYMGHVNSILMAVAKCPNPVIFQKTLSVNDFYHGTEDWKYPMGHISFVGKLDGVTLSAGAPAIAPGFTLDLMANHSLDFWLTSEDLPDPDNRVTLDREGNIVLSYQPNNEEGHTRLIAKLKDLMKKQTQVRRARARLPPGPVLTEPLRWPANSPGGRRPPERHNPLWQQSRHLSARPQLQGARSGQPLRRGWKLLPVERRRESRAHHHGQRATCGRSPDREAIVMLRRLFCTLLLAGGLLTAGPHPLVQRCGRNRPDGFGSGSLRRVLLHRPPVPKGFGD